MTKHKRDLAELLHALEVLRHWGILSDEAKGSVREKVREVMNPGPGGHNKLDPKVIKRIQTLRSRNWTIVEVADKLGLSKSTVSRYQG